MSRSTLPAAVLTPATWLALALAPTAPALAAAPPQPPASYVDTTYTPPGGIVHVVNAGGNLQAALEAAQPGDTIRLQAGATFTGTFTLPVKSGNAWIVVRTSAPDASLPPPGTRIGPAHAALLPRIVSPNSGPALRTEAGAHHFRFIGVEFTVGPAVTLNYGLVALGDGSSEQGSLAEVPHHLILDRVYVHGTATANVRRGICLNSAWTAIIDSYVSDIHEVGADSQAIGGWNGPGPFKIANNHLEGAGENILFGGADPSIPNLVPSDVEIRGNHFLKPRSWRIGDPTYAGRPWSVKNLFELKNARRVLVTGNIFENNWLHAQNGFAVLFTVRNQDGSAPWSTVEDVTFRSNIVRHTGSAVNILGTDNLEPSQRTRRILIKDNVFEDVSAANWGGSGRLFQILDGPSDVDVDHNTAFQSGEVIMATGPATSAFTFRNNIVPHNQYGVAGDGTFGDPLGTLAVYFPAAVFTKNLLIGGDAADYPAGNVSPASWAAVGFTNLAGGNYRLAASSPYRNAGSDGKDLGADIPALEAATAYAVSGVPGALPDATPPVLSGVSASSITASGAVVLWTTNEASDSLAEYGPSTSYGYSTALDPPLVLSHSRTLTGLQPNTLYHYRVRSRDAAGNLALSGDFTFRTLTAPDTTPPTVALTAPAGGATVAGSVVVRANASDNVGVIGVRFQLDGVDLGAEDRTAPYSVAWNTLSATNGAHTLRAIVRDAAGNTATATRSVTVSNGGDTTRPTVSFTAPAPAATVSGSITVTALAADNVGVMGVRFLVDGVPVGAEDLTAPYSVTWDTRTVANGARVLNAVARDAAGNTVSAGRSVTVANGTGIPTGLTWTSLVNAAASGNTLRKTAGCDGCPDAGAVSAQALAAGNGSLEVTATETATQRLIGLSNGNSGTTGADIDFAFQFWPGGTVDVRENGLYRNAETSYAPGDVFRVAVAAGVVRYYKNGALLYTSQRAPAYPLLADTSLMSAGATLGPATLTLTP